MNVQERANRHGSPCPTWCAVDHANPTRPGGRVWNDCHASAREEAGPVTARAFDIGRDVTRAGPEVMVEFDVPGQACGASLFIDPRDAESLALLLESLGSSGAAPDGHVAAAARIRAAAALVFGEAS